jgi:hypothetical protein
VAGAISSDAQTITLLYDSFVAQAGPGITPSEARKNCQLNLQLSLPQGWQFSVFKADYRGYAYLQDGDKGVIKATYYFSGDSTQVSSQLDLKGAYDDNYLKTDEFGIESTVWSPCGEEGLLSKCFLLRWAARGDTDLGSQTSTAKFVSLLLTPLTLLCLL